MGILCKWFKLHKWIRKTLLIKKDLFREIRICQRCGKNEQSTGYKNSNDFMWGKK